MKHVELFKARLDLLKAASENLGQLRAIQAPTPETIQKRHETMALVENTEKDLTLQFKGLLNELFGKLGQPACKASIPDPSFLGQQQCNCTCNVGHCGSPASMGWKLENFTTFWLCTDHARQLQTNAVEFLAHYME